MRGNDRKCMSDQKCFQDRRDPAVQASFQSHWSQQCSHCNLSSEAQAGAITWTSQLAVHILRHETYRCRCSCRPAIHRIMRRRAAGRGAFYLRLQGSLAKQLGHAGKQ